MKKAQFYLFKIEPFVYVVISIILDMNKEIGVYPFFLKDIA